MDWNVLSEYVPSSRCVLYKDLNILLKPLHNKERSKVLTTIAKNISQQEKARSSHRILYPDELISMASSDYVTIGAHTRTHPQLSSLNFNEQEEEILSSKETLEKYLKQSVSVFAYPFGNKVDYDMNSVSVCRKLKFSKVASSFPGQFHSWTDSMQIPRQVVRDWDINTFKKRIDYFLTN